MSAIQEAKWEVKEERPVMCRYQRGNCSPHSIKGKSPIHDYKSQTEDDHHAKNGLHVLKLGVRISTPASVQIGA
jgi:hypothetical protein